MDPLDPEGESVTEIALALLFASTGWLWLRYLLPDAVFARRISIPNAASSRPALPLIAWVEGIGKRWGSDDRALEEVLEGAGLDSSKAAILRGAQLCLACLGAVCGLTAGVGAVLTSPLLAVAGYRLPVIGLRLRAQSRRDEVAASLPDAVDLLAVCTQAGLNLPLSLRRVAESAKGLLGDELSRTVQEIDMGVPRADALQSLAERNKVDDLQALVSALTNAERFGTKISTSLSNFATDIRVKRRRSSEEQARRAPVKMLFPLVFLILPAFVVLTVAPLILGAFRSLGL